MQNDLFGFSHSDCNSEGVKRCTDEHLEKPTQIERMLGVIDEVNAAFADDDAVLAFILETLMEGEGHHGCYCPSPCYEFISAREIQCRSCKLEFWLTAATLFAYKKRPKAWLTAIMLKENHIVIGSPTLAKHLAISQSTAWEMTNTLRLVVDDEHNENELLISSRRLMQIYNRRSCETAAGQHPRSEQLEIDLAEPAVAAAEAISSLCAENGEDTNSLPDQLLNLINGEKLFLDHICERLAFPVGEILAQLTELEIDGLILSHPGNCFTKIVVGGDCDQDESLGDFKPEDVNAIVHLAAVLIKKFAHGTSRKFAQLALHELWLLQDHKRWQKFSLFRLCLKHRPIHSAEIRNYVSPKLVRLNGSFCAKALAR